MSMVGRSSGMNLGLPTHLRVLTTANAGFFRERDKLDLRSRRDDEKRRLLAALVTGQVNRHDFERVDSRCRRHLEYVDPVRDKVRLERLGDLVGVGSALPVQHQRNRAFRQMRIHSENLDVNLLSAGVDISTIENLGA
jgi:hypothetical protein